MRVDPKFGEFVDDLIPILKEAHPDKNFNHAKATRFIKDTYPSDLIFRNLKLKKCKEENEDLISLLDF